MAKLVPQVGTVSYNGFEFPADTETTAFSCTPVLSPDGRTVMYSEYSISFKAMFNGANPNAIDLQMDRAKRALSKSGRVLIYTSRAVGDVIVNQGKVRDVKNGPIPKSISWQPAVGGSLTASVTFTITFCIPECTNAAYINQAMSFTLKPSYQIDEIGYTTRTIDIEIVIPQNKLAPDSRFSHSNVDSFLERIIPPQLPGFRRKFGQRTISADSSTLNISVVDDEFRGLNVPPVGVVEAEASCSFSTSGPGCVFWQATFNASYIVPKNQSLDIAINAFIFFVKGRYQEIAKLDTPVVPGKKSNKVFIPVSYSITEPSVYGQRKVEFSMAATIVTTIEEVFKKGGGLFQKVTGSNDWQRWSASLQNSALNPRGSANLVWSPGRITDLCDADAPVYPNDKVFGLGPRRGFFDLRNEFPPPSKDNSWILYENQLFIESDKGVFATRTLSTTPVDKTVDLYGGWSQMSWNAADGIFTPAATALPTFGQAALNASSIVGGIGKNSPAQIPQGFPIGGRLDNQFSPIGGRLDNQFNPQGTTTAFRRTRPLPRVIMMGSALRAGYPIQVPTLLSVNGVEVLDASDPDRGEKFIQKPVFVSPNGVTWYSAVWKLAFLPTAPLPDILLPILPNPIYPN